MLRKHLLKKDDCSPHCMNFPLSHEEMKVLHIFCTGSSLNISTGWRSSNDPCPSELLYEDISDEASVLNIWFQSAFYFHGPVDRRLCSVLYICAAQSAVYYYFNNHVAFNEVFSSTNEQVLPFAGENKTLCCGNWMLALNYATHSFSCRYLNHSKLGSFCINRIWQNLWSISVLKIYSLFQSPRFIEAIFLFF